MESETASPTLSGFAPAVIAVDLVVEYSSRTGTSRTDTGLGYSDLYEPLAASIPTADESTKYEVTAHRRRACSRRFAPDLNGLRAYHRGKCPLKGRRIASPVHGSLNSPLCSCVSITLPASLREVLENHR
jgi:hypothetical protein